MRFEQDVLHNIAGIDSPSDCAVQPSLDHASQRVAMPLQQFVDRGGIAVSCGMQQLLSLFRIGKHVGTPAFPGRRLLNRRHGFSFVGKQRPQLVETDREILLMRHCEQLGNSEVAELLGLSQPAAGMRYLRALRRLRSVLGIEASPSES